MLIYRSRVLLISFPEFYHRILEKGSVLSPQPTLPQFRLFPQPEAKSLTNPMAFHSRILSRSSQQLCNSPLMLLRGHTLQAYPFSAKGAAAPPTAPPGLKSDELLKNIFLDVKKKYETAIGILRTEKITIAPEDPAAVSQYVKVMKTIREKCGFLSESERIKYTIDSRTADIPDARTYLLTLREIRINRGLTDEQGIEALMIDALDKVENDLKKPLLRNDKEGMAVLLAEFDKINKKLGIRKEELPKYEEQLELNIAKAQLEELKKEALEAMETQKKREEFKDDAMPDVKSLDIRNFL